MQGSDGDPDIENRVWTQWEKGERTETIAWKHIHYHMQKRQQVGVCRVTQLNPVLCDNVDGWGGEGRGAVHEGGAHVYLGLIHAEVWQKPAQYGKAIILQ